MVDWKYYALYASSSAGNPFTTLHTIIIDNGILMAKWLLPSSLL